MPKSLWFTLLLALALLLSGCRSASPLAEVGAAPVEPQSQPATPPDVHTAGMPENSLENPAEQPSDACLSCHSDKQRLIDTAKPEEPDAESESKGVG